MRRILAIACVLVIAACGGDDDDDPVDAAVGSVDAPPVNSADANNNLAPTASFTIEPTCTSSPSTEITFTSTSTDPEDDTLTCMWTFASPTNNPPRDVCTVTPVTFPNFQPYPVTLVVDDGHGNTAMMTSAVAPCN